MLRTMTCMLFFGLMSATAPSSARGETASEAKHPNVIVIVADDLGYADVGCQGISKDISTPNVDTLAASGIRFTNGYVSCPVCSPTRAGLLTGRYQQRFGHEFNPGPPARAEENFGLPLTEKTIADDLKAAGYATGMVGKWHLGYKPQFHPLKRGFESFFGFPGGSHSYVDARADALNPIRRGTEDVDEKEYLTDAFAREAVAYINQHAAERFFLYLTFNAVHTPQQVPDKYLRRFAGIADQKRRTMAAMLSAMDDGVGQVLGALRKHGIEDNTLVFFISDNGGPTPTNGSRNDPLSGFKGQVLEGGIRVPYIVQWKGGLPAGKVYEKPVISLDILPTALAAAGATVPADRKLDGVNLLPFLRGENHDAPHERLFWRAGAQKAMRQGDYKLVMMNRNEPQLFDLAKDIGEKHDLAGQKPDLLAQMKSAFEAWNATLAEPLWGGSRERAGNATRPAGRRNQPEGQAPQGRRERRAERQKQNQ